MEKAEEQTPSNGRQALKYWILMILIWIFLVLELWFIIDIFNKWSDPYYSSASSVFSSRLGELIAFALCVVMALYSIIATLIVIGHIVHRSLKRVQYRVLTRMHSLVLTAFIVHWLIFLAIFFRP